MRRGFTLVELLAVITILALILLITVPIISKVLTNSKNSARKDSFELYGKAIENAIGDYYVKYPTKTDVTLLELENEKMINYKGSKVECNDVQIVGRKVYLNDCKVGNKHVDYTYGKVTPAPELLQGLVPVEYKNNKWVVADPYGDTWYDYDGGKWANAVVLLPGVIKDVGDEVKVDGTEASMMLVWIPRFEYKYTNLGNEYAGGTQTQPGGIDINLILSSRTTPSSNDYIIHPAFKFGDKELSGIWVGKFEISHTTLKNNTTDNNLGCSTTSCQNAEGLRILPGVASLRYNDISNFWYGIKSIENTSSFGLNGVDAHMIKNSEWGAVAYLSQSIYGKYGNSDYEGTQKEVYQNKSSSYITGSSNGTPSQSETNTQCVYNSVTNNCGIGASTTGNIYGVYDMSGGSYEYVMGVLSDNDGVWVGNGNTTNSGFNGRLAQNITYENGAELPNLKYYDVFIKENNDIITSEQNNYGHALTETQNWYEDWHELLDKYTPWLARGGYVDASEGCGIFYANNVSGTSTSANSTRLIITTK